MPSPVSYPATAPLVSRVALVTGASSGIGEATALALSRAGAKVVLAARRLDRLEAIEASICRDGGDALSLQVDVSREEKVRAMIERANEHFGRLDIVVNNAGVMLLSSVTEARSEDWRHMMELNLLGAMYVTQAALPHLKRGGVGHVVNIASVAGRVANPGSSGYAATKFGLVAFSESLRREVYKDELRVTVIEPGMVRTELADHVTNPTMKTGLQERLASLEPLEAEDVAAAVIYAVTQPKRVNVNEILLRPTGQER